jgi:hypothetical protein
MTNIIRVDKIRKCAAPLLDLSLPNDCRFAVRFLPAAYGISAPRRVMLSFPVRSLVFFETLYSFFNDDLRRKGYPLIIDNDCCGYFTVLNSAWKVPSELEKMIEYWKKR